MLRPGYIQIRVTDLDAAIRHYVDRVGLHEVSHEPMAASTSGPGTSSTATASFCGPPNFPGMDYVGFKVASEADLDAFARRIEEYGTKVEEVPAGEQPGVGRRLSFIVPTGHRIELFSEMALSDHGPMTHNPEIWVEEPHGMQGDPV